MGIARVLWVLAFCWVITGCAADVAEQPSSAHVRSVSGYVLVWAIGQSNTSGRAPDRSKFRFSDGQAFKYVRDSSELVLLADPTGNDATALSGRGSWGPAFADEMLTLSNGSIGTVIVNSAEGGTPLSPNWMLGGKQWDQAEKDIVSAMHIAASRRLPIIGTVVYMEQGETDGDNATDPKLYASELLDLRERVSRRVGTKVPFILTSIGTLKSGETQEYRAIREAQRRIVEEVPGIYVGYAGAQNLAQRGLMFDKFHYQIEAYDEIGKSVANTAFVRGIGIEPLDYYAMQ